MSVRRRADASAVRLKGEGLSTGLLTLLGGGGLKGHQTAGDRGVLARLLGVLDPVKGDFAIVTP